ncbi:5066_t:CDS:2 [Ambispora gerdemannii]|uniref:5066_t:CDS:1 n=1 Tax=Ambispora gerdemannii TaxID=144530 RepID=A0A9N9FV80_9GLOM|nr:5066_t:CDS:2 [Ambispora gerdemannii]
MFLDFGADILLGGIFNGSQTTSTAIFIDLLEHLYYFDLLDFTKSALIILVGKFL